LVAVSVLPLFAAPAGAVVWVRVAVACGIEEIALTLGVSVFFADDADGVVTVHAFEVKPSSIRISVEAD